MKRLIQYFVDGFTGLSHRRSNIRSAAKFNVEIGAAAIMPERGKHYTFNFWWARHYYGKTDEYA